MMRYIFIYSICSRIREQDFPSKTTEEFLLVDLVNNIDELAEDREEILKKVLGKASQLPAQKFKQAIIKYGSVKAKKLFKRLLNKK